MTEDVTTKLRADLGRLVQHYQPERLILAPPHAYGAWPASPARVYVITSGRDPAPPCGGLELDITPVVIPEEEFQANLRADNPQAEDLVREGMVVYERPYSG